MKKKSIITSLLALIAMAAVAQTKSATITGYSPAVKDGTLVFAGTGDMECIVDTVQNGRFAFSLPVEEPTDGIVTLFGEGCTNMSITLFLRPGVTINLTGTDCFLPLWKVESPVPEQQTQNRLTNHCREVIKEYIQTDLDHKPWAETEPILNKWYKQQLDLMPTLPVDASTINALWSISRTVKNIKTFPYTEQLQNVEKSMAARAPKEFESLLAEIHYYVYPPKVLQIGDEAVDAELFDLQGNKHHLFEAFADGKYVLLDFWSLGCGPCRMAEPELREAYKKSNGKLEIVGIDEDNLSSWQNHEISKRIVWKNWNDGKRGSSLTSRYCDMGAVPCYILIAPDKRILWRAYGYGPGFFMAIADAVNSLKQDNTANIQLLIRKVDAGASATTVSFRYYDHRANGFSVAKEAYLSANGKRYKVTSADGIKLGEMSNPKVKVSDSTDDMFGNVCYTDFTLTFEPFDTIPATFDFRENDEAGAFTIKNVSLK